MLIKRLISGFKLGYDLRVLHTNIACKNIENIIKILQFSTIIHLDYAASTNLFIFTSTLLAESLTMKALLKNKLHCIKKWM